LGFGAVSAQAAEIQNGPDAVLDGVNLSGYTYPVAYMYFNRQIQAFKQNFQVTVTLNNKTYYIHADDLNFDIDTVSLLNQMWYGDMSGSDMSSAYNYDKNALKSLTDEMVDKLNASAPKGVKGYDVSKSDFESQVDKKVQAAISDEKHTASLKVNADPISDPNAPPAGTTLLGTYTTYTTNSANRNTNIRLCCQFLNRTVVKPGSVFSFNGTLGYTSADRGFKEAGVLVNGELDTGLGGGICQVSSTLYNAVLAAGQKVVERHAHSAAVTYVPTGHDATVNYGTLDFKFQNISKSDIYLIFTYDNRTLTVSLYGRS
jgi:vancomycin resistance protein YoaR